MDTDASNTGIGVLSQIDENGSEHVIAYASRTLSKAERRYCVTRRQLLAVVTFTQQFRPYLLGRQFTLRTDHGSLTWLQSLKEPEGQLARWLEKLQKYQFTIVHRQGKKHTNAKRPVTFTMHTMWESHQIAESTLDVSVVSPTSSHLACYDDSQDDSHPQNLREAQLSDPGINFVL